MASAFTHAFAAVALTKIVSAEQRAWRFWTLLAGSTVLPDADVVGFAFGIGYGDLLEHRGLSHSLLFAAAWSLTVFSALVEVVIGLAIRFPAVSTVPRGLQSFGQDSLCPTRACILERNSTTTNEFSGTRIRIKRALVGDGYGMRDAGRAIRVRAHRRVRYWRCGFHRCEPGSDLGNGSAELYSIFIPIEHHSRLLSLEW
ncbi:MAG TPA: metal-dependent hydrolase [Terriglobales bacterium]|nr:metal-dependent hydrolase [Terriglobales bacterium]